MVPSWGRTPPYFSVSGSVGVGVGSLVVPGLPLLLAPVSPSLPLISDCLNAIEEVDECQLTTDKQLRRLMPYTHKACFSFGVRFNSAVHKRVQMSSQRSTRTYSHLLSVCSYGYSNDFPTCPHVANDECQISNVLLSKSNKSVDPNLFVTAATPHRFDSLCL